MKSEHAELQPAMNQVAEDSNAMNKSKMIQAFKGLAQETRLDIFLYLVQEGANGISAGKICEKFALTDPTISFHLRKLQEAGLIQSERHQQSIVYRADLAAIFHLAEYLINDCCGGGLKALESRAPSLRKTKAIA